MAQIDGFIFDLDGVLCQLRPLYLRSIGCAIADIYGTHARYITDRVVSSIDNFSSTEDRVRSADIPEHIVREIYKVKELLMCEEIRYGIRPIDRIKDTVDYLRLFYPVGVATNCSTDVAELALAVSELTVDCVITKNDVGNKVKPNPLPYSLAASTLSISPPATIAIDDSDIGIRSAIEAGCIAYKLDNFDDLSVEYVEKIIESRRITL